MVEPVRQSGARTVARTRAGRAARRLSGLLALGAVLISGALPAAAAPAGFAASPRYPATITIDSVKPESAVPGDNVTITGTVTNSGSTDLKKLAAAVRVPTKALTNRSNLDEVAQRGDPNSQDGSSLSSVKQGLTDLPAGQSAPLNLVVPVNDLKLTRAGVYALAVDLVGSTPDNNSTRTLGITRTFLPYRSEAITHPTQLAVVWPITHAPGLVAQTMQDDSTIPVLRDDSLAAELAPGGRLHQLVQTGGQLPGLTWVVDPDLLDTVLAMTKPYRVQKPGTSGVGEPAKGENTVPGTGKDAATEWLQQLRTAVAVPGSQVVALPYADPDLASIAHNGGGSEGLTAVLRKAGTAGEVTVEGRLSTEVRSDVAWPYRGYLDQQIAATAAAAGDNLVLTNSASIPDGSLTYTPNAARPIGNGQTAVVADSTVSDLFQADLGSAPARSAAMQRFLAETMVINRQLPEAPRTLLVLPPRHLAASSASTLADAVKNAQGGGWAKLVDLKTVADTPADPDANTGVPGDYPQQLRTGELSAETLGQVMGMQGKLDQLLFILTQPQKVRGPFSAAMVRSMSTEWRTEAPAGSTYRAGVQNYLDGLIGAVKLPTKSVVTLAGDSGTVLVSVKNDLNQAVGNLQLKLESSQPNRLNVGITQDVLLESTTSLTLRFPAKAQNNGRVSMTAQLMTTGPNAQPYGQPVVFAVEVTSVTSGVLYVIGGGVVLILLAAVRFTLQRRKQADEPDDGADDEPAEEEGAEQEFTADAEEPASGDEKVGH